MTTKSRARIRFELRGERKTSDENTKQILDKSDGENLY